MSGVNISICDGKYTVIQAPTGTTRVLRYGEEWRDVTGDNVIGGLAWELQEARDRIKRLEEDLMDAKNKYAVLLADVVLYEDRAERIKRLEDIISRASSRFFRDGSDIQVANGMLTILEEVRLK